MKKLFFLVAIFVATPVNVKGENLLTTELKNALPDLDAFIAANHFPDDNHFSDVWEQDKANYRTYKLPRFEQDGVTQNWDSVWAYLNQTYAFILYRIGADSVMNAPFLSDANWELQTNNKYKLTCTGSSDFPAMNHLEELCDEMKEFNTNMGEGRVRLRPYYYFSDYYNGTKYRRENADKNANTKKNAYSSYPSGHGYFAGLFGACLRYIDPTNAEKIDKMVDEWLHCRLLLGAHWESDLPAGKKLGLMAYNNAIGIEQFRDTLEAAKEELYQYRMAQPSGVPMPANVDPDHAGVYYSTFYDGTNKFMLPAGVEAYIASVDGDALKLTKIAGEGDVIPAATAVILKATSAAFNLKKSEDAPVTFTEVNTLKGKDAAADAPANCYVLSGKADDNSVIGVGFYKFSGRLGAHKAYIELGGSSIIKRLRFVFAEDQTTTDCKAVTGQKSTVRKMLKDGQLYILRDGKTYNAQGQEVE